MSMHIIRIIISISIVFISDTTMTKCIIDTFDITRPLEQPSDSRVLCYITSVTPLAKALGSPYYHTLNRAVYRSFVKDGITSP